MTFNITKKRENTIPYALLDVMDCFFIYKDTDEPDRDEKLYFLNLGDNVVFSLDEQETTTFEDTDLVCVVPDSAVTITIQE